LDPLLVGDILTLENLDLMGNQLQEKDAIQFFRKMPKMTCLKHVSLLFNPFFYSSKSWKDVLAEIAWQYRSLECVMFVYDDCDEEYTHEPSDIPELNLPLSLNRGGRRELIGTRIVDTAASQPMAIYAGTSWKAKMLYHF